MNILALCCAFNNSFLGISYDDKNISRIIKSDENYHSLYLMPEIKKIFSENNFDFKKLDLIAINLGPGSFSGLRVALSIAKIMAYELNIPLVGLNSSEILLNAYNCDYLLMDARRDMYFLGTKDKIELIYKKELNIDFSNKKLLCDKNCFVDFPNSICFENENLDISKTIIKLAIDKFVNSKDKSEFDAIKVQANYIQTPPIF